MLARHAETEWSLSGQHTGRTDLPLTEAGRAKAEMIGRGLDGETFARVLTSPLTRATETCHLAGYGEHAEPRDELLEWDYGDYEGVTTQAVHEQRPDWELWQHGTPGGESPEQVARRADRLVDELSSMSAEDGDVLVFGHGHQLRALAVRWIGLPIEAGRRLRFGTGAISGLGWMHENHVIDFWNDRTHLRDFDARA